LYISAQSLPFSIMMDKPLPDGVTPLGAEAIMEAIVGMQHKSGQSLDKCFAVMRKWGAESRVTPQKKTILADDVEAAIVLCLKGNGNGTPAAVPVLPGNGSETPAAARVVPEEAAATEAPEVPASVPIEFDMLASVPIEVPIVTAMDEIAVVVGAETDVALQPCPATEPQSKSVPVEVRPQETGKKGKRKSMTLEERNQLKREKKEELKRQYEAEIAAKEKLAEELARPFEGLSLDEMRQKRLSDVLAAMEERMKEIACRIAQTLGLEPPTDEMLAQICSASDGGCGQRETYMRLIHTKNEAVPMPEGLEANLMPYQVDGLEWLVSIYVNHLHGILADEMGLGKTIQTIAFIQFLKEFKGNKGPHLIVAPKSTLSHWETEFKRFAPSYKVWLIMGDLEEREHLANKLRKRIKSQKTVLYVTNYEMIHRNEWLQEFEWQCIIIDEGHRMKNIKSLLHETMTRMKCRTRVLLTGTPLQNNLGELWALLHYLLPELFATTLDFQAWFLEPLRGVKGLNEYEVQLGPSDEEQLISRLHLMLAPFLLQRTKAQVMENRLPPKSEVTVRVPLSAWQQSCYTDLQQRSIKLLNSEDKVETRKVNNALMQLRKLVLHPYLFLSEYQVNEDIFRVSGKVEVLDRMLPKLLRFGHKMLIFSQFTSMLDVLQAYLQWRAISHLRLDGSTPHEERRRRLELFNSGNGGDVFLLSARAGGLGLNLQTADTVIFFDLDWNPQNDKQAVARSHRFGQKREVRVFRLMTDSGVERHMEARCVEKLDLEKKIIGAGMFAKGASQEQRVDMLRRILGASAEATAEETVKSNGEGEHSPFTSPNELNQLLARSSEELAAFSTMDEEVMCMAGGKVEAWPDLVACGRLLRQEEVPRGFAFSTEADEEEDFL